MLRSSSSEMVQKLVAAALILAVGGFGVWLQVRTALDPAVEPLLRSSRVTPGSALSQEAVLAGPFIVPPVPAEALAEIPDTPRPKDPPTPKKTLNVRTLGRSLTGPVDLPVVVPIMPEVPAYSGPEVLAASFAVPPGVSAPVYVSDPIQSSPVPTESDVVTRGIQAAGRHIAGAFRLTGEALRGVF